MPTWRDLLRAGIGAPLGCWRAGDGVLPLPPLALDVLFTFNIALSVVVVMAVVNVARPLEFGIFPTVLLLATLLRLALNVASTRVVLLHGHSGPRRPATSSRPSASSWSAATSPSASWCSSS